MDKYDYSPFIEFFEKHVRPEWVKNEKSAFTANELLQPGMFYASFISFLLTPAKAKRMILDRKSDTGCGMRDFINDVFDEINAWLFENVKLIKELEMIASGFTCQVHEDGFLLDGADSITPEIEDAFIGENDNYALIKTKVKLLAAIDVQLISKKLCIAYSEHNTFEFSECAFLLYRSMLQFSSFAAMLDGFVFQYKRMQWARMGKDRSGLETFIRNIIREHGIDSKAAKKIWDKIRVESKSKGGVSLNNNYTISYLDNPASKGKYDGAIIQTDPSGADDPIKFEAFKSFLRDRRKRGVIA